ncbi:uncharacterized protein LOC125087731 [Lutra lutra]|uniref:uncharacterized protein LOC125087731 n=1 Tax=Lutra lutra TaxID=9657 RepID=UPI001FD465D7|nr:uncharacterized protein LOC125087731 [Lutra lutra]
MVADGELDTQLPEATGLVKARTVQPEIQQGDSVDKTAVIGSAAGGAWWPARPRVCPAGTRLHSQLHTLLWLHLRLRSSKTEKPGLNCGLLGLGMRPQPTQNCRQRTQPPQRTLAHDAYVRLLTSNLRSLSCTDPGKRRRPGAPTPSWASVGRACCWAAFLGPDKPPSTCRFTCDGGLHVCGFGLQKRKRERHRTCVLALCHGRTARRQLRAGRTALPRNCASRNLDRGLPGCEGEFQSVVSCYGSTSRRTHPRNISCKRNPPHARRLVSLLELGERLEGMGHLFLLHVLQNWPFRSGVSSADRC